MWRIFIPQQRSGPIYRCSFPTLRITNKLLGMDVAYPEQEGGRSVQLAIEDSANKCLVSVTYDESLKNDRYYNICAIYCYIMAWKSWSNSEYQGLFKYAERGVGRGVSTVALNKMVSRYGACQSILTLIRQFLNELFIVSPTASLLHHSFWFCSQRPSRFSYGDVFKQVPWKN